jgi:hydrogenase nickel incorporation protein HypA/HybF
VHELAVAQAIVAAAERHAEGRPVSVVGVRVGRLRQVVPEYLSFCFEVAAKETLCEGPELESPGPEPA